MYYYNPDKRSGRTTAGIATALYVVMWALLMLLVVFPAPEKLEYGNGLLIDFGNIAEAGGRVDPAASEIEQAAVSSPASASQPTEQLLTSDDEEAPVVEQQRKPQKPMTTASQQPASKPAEKTQPAPAREVNRRALFPGRTVGSNSASEGVSEGAGNQGDEGGSPAGSHEGMGSGNSSSGFELAGRSLVGSLPKPVYPADKSGKVVVRITVDKTGKVTSASYRSVGSTTNAGVLVDAALKAARQARFSPSETQDIQTGTITYVFKME